MIFFISAILSIIFLVLGIIHINWAIGNSWGLSKALPTSENGDKLFTPGTFACLAVGIALTVVCLFYQIRPQDDNPKNWIFDYGGWLIPALFLIRAMGDFKYVGFFKKVTSTEFAMMDTKYYTPLCLGIGVLGIIVQLLK